MPTTDAPRLPGSDFRENLFAELRRVGRPFSASRGTLLQAPDAPQSPLYLLDAGAAQAFVDTASGRQTLRLGYPGELLAALPGLLLGVRSPLGIEALRACRGFSLSRIQLDQFLDGDPTRRSAYTLMLEGLVCSLMARELDLLEPDPAERYRLVLQRSPQLFQHVPLRYIASYLRMSPETLSRIRGAAPGSSRTPSPSS